MIISQTKFFDLYPVNASDAPAEAKLGMVSRVDVWAMVGLIRAHGCKHVVEIGANDGATAAAILRACPGIESYVGIDVPPGTVPEMTYQAPEVPAVAGALALGDSRYRVIVRPRGSRDVSSGELGPVDFVFIDGDHSESGVAFDTELARAAMKSGVICWHDYGNWMTNGPKAVIDHLNRIEGDHICLVEGTMLCYEIRGGRQSRVVAAADRADVAFLPGRVCCLSLDSRPDRWSAFSASAADWLGETGLQVMRWRARPPAEMIIPDWTPANPKRDEYYATRADHLAMIERAYLDGLDSILIFEDDAVLKPEFARAYARAVRDLPEGWMGLWFGGQTGQHGSGFLAQPEPVSPYLWRLRGVYSTHAYMLSRRGMHRVYSHVLHEFKRLYDHATASLQQIEPWFFITPSEGVIQTGNRHHGT